MLLFIGGEPSILVPERYAMALPSLEVMFLASTAVLPMIAVHLFSIRRARTTRRSTTLLHLLLYRPPQLHPDSELSPDHVEVVEHGIDMSWSDELADQDGEWREW